LTEAEPSRVLLGLFAARSLEARDLAPVVDTLQTHPDPTIRRAATATLTALRSEGEAAARQAALAMLQALCQQAIPVLAAQPDRIWLVWRYLEAGQAAGVRYDGVTRLDDRWGWFPKPYRVVGTILRR
jgi:hypothetical protein